MVNLFDPEDEYYNLLSWHSSQRQRLVEQNMLNLGRVMAKHRAELYETRIANKPLALLVKKHVQEEAKQILQDKRTMSQLLTRQTEELKEFISLVKLIYPKFDGLDELLRVDPSLELLNVS